MRILLSIKPQYAELIFAGSKRFEFRRVVHKNLKVKTVVVYATKPVGKVIGEFAVSEIHGDSPERLWRKTRRHSGITKGFFNEYFHGRDKGFAIGVGKAKRYKIPLELREVLPNGFPPQSFVYLHANESPE
jgi:predicted transcriptional regulator